MMKTDYNPDVLTCLANLSNDEVFTPPTVVNQMLDLLPQEIWSDSSITFLDPFTKTGVFLREIAKRLIKGLEDEFPDQQDRINHIFKNQIFGIAITELTSLVARRSVYCTKDATSEYSIVDGFENEQGNIIFNKTKHSWEGNKCKFCGASKEVYERENELESHAYEFLHTTQPEKIFNMRFDVIIGNPPYQLNDGGGTGDSAKPIYNLFIEQAIKLKPRYISMIIPSRWMKGGKGLDKFRNDILNDKHFSYIYDFEDGKECFQGLNIDGGVCYFLWNSDHNTELNYIYKPKGLDEISSKRFLKNNFTNTVIRDYRQLSIIEKIHVLNEDKFSSIVSSRKPFGIATDLFNSPQTYNYDKIPTKEFKNSVKIYGVKGNKGGAKRVEGFVDRDIISNKNLIDKYKLFQSYAYSTTSTVPPEIISGMPGEVCTETFLLIGPFQNKKESNNCLIYTKTKFYRALLFFNRIQKNLSQSTFDLIPLQNFTEVWTDEKLYKKYNLSEDEIAYIETLIKPMS